MFETNYLEESLTSEHNVSKLESQHSYDTIRYIYVRSKADGRASLI